MYPLEPVEGPSMVWRLLSLIGLLSPSCSRVATQSLPRSLSKPAFSFLAFFALSAYPFIPIPHSSIDPSISTKRLNNSIWSIIHSVNQPTHRLDFFDPKNLRYSSHTLDSARHDQFHLCRFRFSLVSLNTARIPIQSWPPFRH